MKVCIVQRPTVKDKKNPTQKPTPQFKKFTQNNPSVSFAHRGSIKTEGKFTLSHKLDDFNTFTENFPKILNILAPVSKAVPWQGK